MIALAKSRRTVEAVSRRVELARALRLANPQMSTGRIGEEIGASGAMVKFYLAGKIKRLDRRPRWAEKFYAAAGLLAYGDEKAAAAVLRSLAEDLGERTHAFTPWNSRDERPGANLH